MRSLSADVILPLSADPERDACVAVGPGADEILWLTGPRAAVERETPDLTKGLRLHSYRQGPEVTTRPWRGRQRPHFVQRTRDGLLFVAARTAGDDQPNARATDRELRPRRMFALGDGIADVRVSPAGVIWAGYIDEAVFGQGLGAAGLVAFDRAGRPRWQYDPTRAGTDDIAEVYALNLAAEDDAWVYFYSQFAIVRWLKGAPTAWRTRVRGARALAVRGGRALLLGDEDDPTALRILELPRGGGAARVKSHFRLHLPEGTDVESIQAYGVADRIVLWSARHMMIVERW